MKAATSGPVWYQVYLVGGRDVARPSIAGARTAGFSALVVTIDTPVSGLRERDVRNGVRQLLWAGLIRSSALRVAVPGAAALARRLLRPTAGS